MSTETVKKGDKKKVSKTLVEKSVAFAECFWVEFFGKSKQEAEKKAAEKMLKIISNE